MKRLAEKRIQLLCLVGAITTALFFAPVSVGKQSKDKSDAVEENQLKRDLHQIGERLAKAVVQKDVETLLGYDRSDLRHEDEAALKNPESDLYCYLFDSSCIAPGKAKWLSVYDKLSRAQQLEIKVSLTRSTYNQKVYGSLIFYDRSSVSAASLKSPAFLCKEQGVQFVSWKFKLEDGKWKPVTPLFDNETDGLCQG